MQATGSRTIIHHRDLPEYSFPDFLNALKTSGDCKMDVREYLCTVM